MSDPRGPRDDDERAGLPAGAKLPDVEPPPDFLADVQAKIRKRSGGKFYRSRWATSPVSTLVRIVSLLMLLAIVLVWLLSSPVRDLGPDSAAPDAGQGLRPPVKIRSSGSGSPGSPPSPPPR